MNIHFFNYARKKRIEYFINASVNPDFYKVHFLANYGESRCTLTDQFIYYPIRTKLLGYIFYADTEKI